MLNMFSATFIVLFSEKVTSNIFLLVTFLREYNSNCNELATFSESNE